MPLSNAERQRLYRLRRDADPTKRAEYVKKKKDKYKADLESHKRKRVGDMNPREQRQQRRTWRCRQKLCRRKQRELMLAVSDENGVSSSLQASTPTSTPRATSSTNSSTRGRKRVQRNRSALYRENCNLRQDVRKTQTLVERYKKRLQRLLKTKKNVNSPSPRKLTKSIMKQGRPEIRRTLTFHNALVAQIKKKYKEAPSVNSKTAVTSAVTGSVIRKYRLLTVLSSRTGICKRTVMKVTCGIARKQNARAFPQGSCKKVQGFFEREDISRVCPGIKQTITRHGVKKQKRILTDSVKNLHRKFLSEGGHVSYAKFCKLRPFWTVQPKETDRETCLCYMHENLQNMTHAMRNKGLLPVDDVNDLVPLFMCSVDSIECAYSECGKCSQSEFTFSRFASEAEINFPQWETGKKTYTQNGQEKQATVTAKVMKTVTETEAVGLFLSAMKAFKKHWFTMRRQFAAFRDNKNRVRDDECVVHVDFSENFNCKYHSEIQAVHFGASHAQASLHTLVLYIKSQQPLCLCTISANLQHGPVGIWAHMKPVLRYIRTEFPQVQNLTFWSDGPSSQYKQKKNFFLLSTVPFAMGFKSIGWNFFESSHGKGAVDGVGATVKRLANDAVCQGADIDTPRKLFEVMAPLLTSVHLMYIEDEDFKCSEGTISQHVPLIHGTRSIHQINCTDERVIVYRKLSCFCQWESGNRLCLCHNPKTFTYDLQHKTPIRKPCIRIVLKTKDLRQKKGNGKESTPVAQRGNVLKSSRQKRRNKTQKVRRYTSYM